MDSIEWIVVASDASDELHSAIDDLRSLWPVEVRVSKSELKDAVLPKYAIILDRVDRPWMAKHFGSFAIQRERTQIYIRSATDAGLVNGVYAICKDVLGARWYWATSLGFEQVGEIFDKFPERRWREAPDFVQRRMQPVDAAYTRRNRLSHVYQFNHALAEVFTPALYEAEPELFALIKGKRLRPFGNKQYDPQPDFTNPRVVELAAEAAIAYFEAHPSSSSFSLSTNDNVLFDTSEWTELAVEPVQYFRGRPNYTDLVFGFMNQVSERVFEDEAMLNTSLGQPRYLTALAYFWTEPSPVIELHPRVMPVLTSDRAQWHDPEYRAEDKALAERWMESGAARIATWDYYFGAPYPYPRQFTQWIDESLKHLNKIGVDVFYSSIPSTWGMDGAKAWVAAELLWDSQQDVEVLLDEFYNNFFGAGAAPMRQFYELAEVHRNMHEGEAEWIKFYKDEAGIELFTPELISEMRSCIQDATTQVSAEPRYAARVQVVSDAFRFTELYAVMQHERVKLVDATLAGAPSLKLIERFIKARADFKQYAKQLIKDPLHARLQSFARILQSDPVPVAMAAMKRVSVDGYEQVYAALHALGESERPESLLTNVELEHDGFTRFSFLGPYVPIIEGWKFDFRPSEKFRLLPIESNRGVRIEGADMSSMFADLDVEAGQAYFLELNCAYSVSPDNRTQVQLTWKDGHGKRLRVQVPLRFPNGLSDGVVSVSIPMVAPENAEELRIHFTQSRQYAGDFFELHSVDLRR